MKKQTSKKNSMEQLDLLLAFENIVDLAENSSLNAGFYQKADAYISYVSDKLGISKRASVILALFADKCDDCHILLSDFTEFLDCRILTLMRYTNELQELIDKEYICQYKDDSIFYSFSLDAMEAFRRNQDLVQREVSGLSEALLFEEFDNLFDKCNDKKMDSEMLRKKLENLVRKNENLPFVKAMKNYYDIDYEDYNFPLFIRICTLFVVNYDDNIGLFDLNRVCDKGEFIWRTTKSALSRGKHCFFTMKFIENTNDNGLIDRESFKITDDAKAKLFAGLDLPPMREKCLKDGLIPCKNIKSKSLFYNAKEKQQVDELESLLEEKNFKKIQERLNETNFRQGFACLFYGAPGTGKTETVLQMARRTGRDLIQVNISEIKSMWVGESEKNIKAIFDDYRKRVSSGSKIPILLFNEADAIIGKRKVGAEQSVERMENSIQNIILQEMEQLDGILIAATNLAENMDKAFERRFLYKIKFEKPDLMSRSQIWKSMIPQLTTSDAKKLASEYDFSGGEIENIARHLTVQTILYGKPKDLLGDLRRYCDSERLSCGNAKNKIGF